MPICQNNCFNKTRSRVSCLKQLQKTSKPCSSRSRVVCWIHACVSIPHRMIDLWHQSGSPTLCVQYTRVCVQCKLSMASKWNIYISTLHMNKIYFVSGCFSFSSAIRSGRTIVKQDLGCACKELKYEIKSGDSLCKTLTPYFSSSSSGTVGPRPLKKMYWYQSIRTYPCIRDGFLLWILLGGSDRKSHVSSCGEHPGAIGCHLVEVRDHWPELHLSQG